MKTINTAAYAAVAATTSNGLFTVATLIMAMNTQMNPVIMPNLDTLVLTNSSHHMGESSIMRPTSITLMLVNFSNVLLLE